MFSLLYYLSIFGVGVGIIIVLVVIKVRIYEFRYIAVGEFHVKIICDAGIECFCVIVVIVYEDCSCVVDIQAVNKIILCIDAVVGVVII